MTLRSVAFAPLPWPGGAYSIKRHGVKLTHCDAEAAQMPGCIQGHDALLVVRRGDPVVLQARENSADLPGLAPEDLLGQPIDVVTAVVIAGDQAPQLVAKAQGCQVGAPVFGNHLAETVGMKFVDHDAVQAGELANLLHGDRSRLPFGMGVACELLAQSAWRCCGVAAPRGLRS